MAQLVHETAPGAQIVFCAANDGNAGVPSDESMAAAVSALEQAGCDIIVDDIDAPDSPVFQLGSPLDNAVESSIQKGGDYFSAAGNDGSQYYQGPPQQQTVDIPGVGTVNNATLVGVDPASNGELNLNLYWNEPFGSIGNNPGAQTTFKLYLYDASTGSVVPESNAQIITGGSAPDEPNDPIAAVLASGLDPNQKYELIASVASGPIPSLIRVVASNNTGSLLLAPGTPPSTSGDLYGHELVPGINNVGAAGVAAIQTAQSTSPPGQIQNEPYSEYGPGEILFSPNGTPLSAPQPGPGVTFTAPDGSTTSLGDFATFTGTSAAAPVAAAVSALMLQADPNLGTAQVTQILQETAIPMVNPAQAGAGLIQAQSAVELAEAYKSIASAASTSNNSIATPSVVTIAADTANFVNAVSNAVISAPSGNHMYFIYGNNDALVTPSGTQSGVLALSNSTIILGSGDDKVSINGSKDTIDGADGSNILINSGSDNTILLPAYGQGVDTIFGNVLQNGTELNFQPLLAQTGWDGNQATIGDFLKLTERAGNTLIQVDDPTGSSKASFTTVAILEGQTIPSLDNLLHPAMT